MSSVASSSISNPGASRRRGTTARAQAAVTATLSPEMSKKREEFESIESEFKTTVQQFNGEYLRIVTYLQSDAGRRMLGDTRDTSKVGVSRRSFIRDSNDLNSTVTRAVRDFNIEKDKFATNTSGNATERKRSTINTIFGKVRGYVDDVNRQLQALNSLVETADLLTGISAELPTSSSSSGYGSESESEGRQSVQPSLSAVTEGDEGSSEDESSLSISASTAKVAPTPTPTPVGKVYYAHNPESSWDAIQVRSAANSDAPVVGTISWEQAGDEVVGKVTLGNWLELDLEVMKPRITNFVEGTPSAYVRIRGDTTFLKSSSVGTWESTRGSDISVAPGTESKTDKVEVRTSPVATLTGTETTGSDGRKWVRLDDETAKALGVVPPVFALVSAPEVYLVEKTGKHRVGIATLVGGTPESVVIGSFAKDFGDQRFKTAAQLANAITAEIVTGQEMSNLTLPGILNPSYVQEKVGSKAVQSGQRVFVDPDALKLEIRLADWIQNLVAFIRNPSPSRENIPNVSDIPADAADPNRRLAYFDLQNPEFEKANLNVSVKLPLNLYGGLVETETPELPVMPFKVDRISENDPRVAVHVKLVGKATLKVRGQDMVLESGKVMYAPLFVSTDRSKIESKLVAEMNAGVADTVLKMKAANDAKRAEDARPDSEAGLARTEMYLKNKAFNDELQRRKRQAGIDAALASVDRAGEADRSERVRQAADSLAQMLAENRARDARVEEQLEKLKLAAATPPATPPATSPAPEFSPQGVARPDELLAEPPTEPPTEPSTSEFANQGVARPPEKLPADAPQPNPAPFGEVLPAVDTQPIALPPPVPPAPPAPPAPTGNLLNLEQLPPPKSPFSRALNAVPPPALPPSPAAGTGLAPVEQAPAPQPLPSRATQLLGYNPSEEEIRLTMGQQSAATQRLKTTPDDVIARRLLVETNEKLAKIDPHIRKEILDKIAEEKRVFEGEEVTGGRKILDRIEGYIAKNTPSTPSIRGGALSSLQRVRVRSALELKKGSFYERYPEDQKFTLYYPERDENSTTSWTTFPSNQVGDKIKISVKNPHGDHPTATVAMLGGANNTYSFEFRIKHMRHDAYEDAIDRARRAEYRPPTKKQNPLRDMTAKEMRSNPTFKRGLAKAQSAASAAKRDAELQSDLNAPIHPFAVPEGGTRTGTRKNGRRHSKIHRRNKKK